MSDGEFWEGSGESEGKVNTHTHTKPAFGQLYY